MYFSLFIPIKEFNLYILRILLAVSYINIYLYMKKSHMLMHAAKKLRNPAPAPYYFIQFGRFIFLKIHKISLFYQAL